MVERVLDGRYALEMLVGSGGMADVYRAKDQLLERTVAVKILHQQYENDKEFIERFQREAKAAARITHPNIVNVHDVGVAEEDHKNALKSCGNPHPQINFVIRRNHDIPP